MFVIAGERYDLKGYIFIQVFAGKNLNLPLEVTVSYFLNLPLN